MEQLEKSTKSTSYFVLQASEGEAWWSVGDRLTFKLGPRETRGAFALAEMTAYPGMGPPPHVHALEDELFYVLDGHMQFIRGDDVFDAGPGDAFFLPRDVVHQFRNVGDTPARLLVMALPCGFEEMIAAFGVRAKPGDTPPAPTPEDIGRVIVVCEKFGIRFAPQHQPTNPLTPRPKQRSLWVLGARVDLKLTRQQTGGKLTLATIHCNPGVAVPTHRHPCEDELFYIERGTFEYVLDGDRLVAPPGTTVFVPRGTWHGFTNVGDGPAQLVSCHLPGGFEEFFIEAGTECLDPAAPPPPLPEADQLLQTMLKHGMDVPRPPER